MGSTGETLPNHVGMPIGEKFGGATYFMLETHYDNPSIEQDLVDTSGKNFIRFFVFFLCYFNPRKQILN